MTKKEEAEAKRQAKIEIEKQRIYEMKTFERRLNDCALICGIDEAGRGPFAGPVVAGAVILDWKNDEKDILYLNDSKKLTEKRREALFMEILQKSIAVGVGIVGAKIIDKINILQATYLAMNKALNNLTDVSHLLFDDIGMEELVKRFILFEADLKKENVIRPDYLLVDAVTIPETQVPQEGIIKGDAKSVSIAAASVIAKVARDHIMYEYDRKYPEYGFASNKGYGTKAHIEAIKQHGMLDIHRRSFIHF